MDDTLFKEVSFMHGHIDKVLRCRYSDYMSAEERIEPEEERKKQEDDALEYLKAVLNHLKTFDIFSPIELAGILRVLFLENRIEEAVQAALNSPLLETSISGAKSILLYVSGGYDMGMLDINTIAEKVQTEADPDANIIFGAAISEEMNERISVTIIATDFGNVKANAKSGIIDAPAESAARGTSSLPRVTIDGLEGFEADLDSLLSDKGTEAPGTDFDIPDFLR